MAENLSDSLDSLLAHGDDHPMEVLSTRFGYRPALPSPNRGLGFGSNRISFELIVLQSDRLLSFTTSTPSMGAIESWPSLLIDIREEYRNRSGLPSNATMPWLDDTGLDTKHPYSFLCGSNHNSYLPH